VLGRRLQWWHNLRANVVLLTLQIARAVSSLSGAHPVAMAGIPPGLVGAVLPVVALARFETVEPDAVDANGALIGWRVTLIARQETFTLHREVPVLVILFGWFWKGPSAISAAIRATTNCSFTGEGVEVFAASIDKVDSRVCSSSSSHFVTWVKNFFLLASVSVRAVGQNCLFPTLEDAIRRGWSIARTLINAFGRPWAPGTRFEQALGMSITVSGLVKSGTLNGARKYRLPPRMRDDDFFLHDLRHFGNG